MDKKYLKGQLRKENDKIEFVATDETLDRHGEVVPISSWDFKNFKKAPRLLVNHDYNVESIVGVAKKLRQEGKKIIFEPVFHNITELARETEEMVKQNFLNTVSVGYYPRMKGEGENAKEINELLEISLVAIPANPNARRLSVKSLSDEEKSKTDKLIAQFVDELGEDEPEPEKPTDIKTLGEQELEDNLEKIKQEKTKVQTLIFDKEVFKTKADVKAWVKEHGFIIEENPGIDETENSWRVRQFEPSKCQENTMRTIELTKGVKAVICRPQASLALSEITAKELIKSLNKHTIALEKFIDEKTPDEPAPPEMDDSKPAGDDAGQRSEKNADEVVISRDVLEELRNHLRVNDKHNELILKTLNKKLSDK